MGKIKKFTHISEEKSLDLNKKYPRNFPGNHKPYGLWMAPSNEWIEWARENLEEYLKNKAYLHEIQIYTKSTLKISNLDDVLNLCDIYGITFLGEKSNSYICDTLDFEKIKSLFKGLIIENYHETKSSTLLLPLWYSTLDVNSACIWDLSCIESIKTKAWQDTL